MLLTVVYNVYIIEVLFPTNPIVVRNTLSKVVIPRVVRVGILEVFTTTASANVIGTNSELF